MKKTIEVFDFNEEDELAESAAGKLLEKFTNPSPCHSPVLQRQRIQSFCNGKRVQKQEHEGPSCVEPATAVDDHHCEDAPTLITEAEESRTSLTFRLETSDHIKETDAQYVNHGLMFGLNTEDLAKETDVDHDNHRMMFGLNTEDDIKETDVDHGLVSFSCQPGEKSYYAETSSYSQRQLKSSLSDSSSSQEQNDMMSVINESLSDRSALSETTDSEGDDGTCYSFSSDFLTDMLGCPPISDWVLLSILYGLKDWMAEHLSNDVEKIDLSTAVIMTSEYVILKDIHCATSLVIFSCNGIKIKSYLTNNEEGPLSCEFGVEDIVSIQYNWYQNVSY